MLSDLLYGSRWTRSYRLDLDTVRELGEAIRESDPKMFVTYSVQAPGGTREIAPSALDKLSAADLSRLIVDGRYRMGVPDAPYAGPVASVGLLRTGSWVQAMKAPDSTGASTGDEVLGPRLWQIIEDSGRPLLKRRRFRPRRWLAWVPFLALVAAWLWLELTTVLPTPAHIIGWAFVVIAFLVTRPIWQRAKIVPMDTRPLLNGHIVLSETRRETAARRADRRRDIRVAIYSVLGTLLTGLLVGAILYFTLGIGAPASTPIPSPSSTP